MIVLPFIVMFALVGIGVALVANEIFIIGWMSILMSSVMLGVGLRVWLYGGIDDHTYTSATTRWIDTVLVLSLVANYGIVLLVLVSETLLVEKTVALFLAVLVSIFAVIFLTDLTDDDPPPTWEYPSSGGNSRKRPPSNGGNSNPVEFSQPSTGGKRQRKGRRDGGKRGGLGMGASRVVANNERGRAEVEVK